MTMDFVLAGKYELAIFPIVQLLFSNRRHILPVWTHMRDSRMKRTADKKDDTPEPVGHRVYSHGFKEVQDAAFWYQLIREERIFHNAHQYLYAVGMARADLQSHRRGSGAIVHPPGPARSGEGSTLQYPGKKNEPCWTFDRHFEREISDPNHLTGILLCCFD